MRPDFFCKVALVIFFFFTDVKYLYYKQLKYTDTFLVLLRNAIHINMSGRESEFRQQGMEAEMIYETISLESYVLPHE